MGVRANLPQADKNREKGSVHVGAPVRKEDKSIPPYLGEDYESHWGAFSFAGKTILDVGADYGSTGYFFLQKGGKKVIAVEADPSLFNQLVSNCRNYPEVIPVNLEVSQPKHFKELIEKYHPDVLKADCEGCEIHLLGVDENVLKSVPEYLIETHDHIALNAIRPRIEELFEKIGYSHNTIEVIPTVEVVHAKRTWDISTISEKDFVSLKNEVSLKKQELQIAKQRLASQKEHAANLEKELGGVQGELHSLSTDLKYLELELDIIKSSFGYSLMRFYGGRMDRAFPDGTRRGEFKKIVTSAVRVASKEGIRNLFELAFEKIRRREFRINPTAPLGIESQLNVVDAVRSVSLGTPLTHKVILHCDTPILSSTTTTKVSNAFVVSGWVLADPPVSGVKIYLDNELLGPAEYGTVRTSVGESYPGFPDSHRSGFRKFVSVDQKGTPRRCQLKIVAEVENSPAESIESTIEIGETPSYRPVSENVGRKLLNGRISVAILTRSPPDGFEQTLERLRNQRGASDIEIIIINSGTSDLSYLQERYKVRISKISPQDFGHASTRNYAAQKATGKYIVFMTDDAIPASDELLHNMIQTLEGSNSIAAVTARQIPRSDADPMYCQAIWGHYRMLGLNQDRIVGSSQLEHLTPQQKREICQIDDVCSCFRTDIFLKYKYAHTLEYAEDLELGMRLVKDGFKIAQLYSTGVIHSHNRPPSYYLRRSYVDYKVLSRLLGYEPPKSYPSDSWDDLLNSANNLCGSLDHLIDDLLSCQLCQYNISKTFEMVRNAIRHGHGSTEPRTNTKPRNEDLMQIMHEILTTTECQPKTQAISHHLADSYLRSLGTFEKWLINTRQDLKGMENEFPDTLYKVLATEIGNAVAEFMAHRTQAGHHDANAIELDRLLTKGV